MIVLAGLGWFYLALLLAGSDGTFEGFRRLDFAGALRTTAGWIWSVSGVAIVASMWGAMTLAMMLPSAAPMIMTYAGIADTAARKNERIVSPFVLAAGYTAVWFGFSVIAALAQIVLTQAALLDTSMTSASGLLLGRNIHRRRPLPVLCAQARLSQRAASNRSRSSLRTGPPHRAAYSGWD